jgi:hypothetical protein
LILNEAKDFKTPTMSETLARFFSIILMKTSLKSISTLYQMKASNMLYETAVTVSHFRQHTQLSLVLNTKLKRLDNVETNRGRFHSKKVQIDKVFSLEF